MLTDSRASRPAPISRTERWRRIGIVALGLVALLGYIALIATNLSRAREREQDAAQRNLEGLSKVLENHALATVEKIDTVLVAGRLRLEEQARLNRPAAEFINRSLRAHLGLIDESQSLRVADADGRFIYDATGKPASATITDREYFQHNRDDPQGKLVISEPLFARITSNWVITLSRRIDDAGGRFAGLIQAAVRADYFQDFYAALNLGQAHSVTLIDDRLRMVARFPPMPEQLGKPLDSPVLREMAASGAREKTYVRVSAVDGVERLYAVRKVGDYPLYVLVGRSTQDIMAEWRRQLNWSIAGVVALSLVMLGWIVVWLRSYASAQALAERMTAAYRTTMQRIRALLDSLPDPAWLADRDQRMIAVNEAYAQACGRSQQDIAGKTVGEIWPETVAAPLAALDAAALDAHAPLRQEHMLRIAGGEQRYYECIATPAQDEREQFIGVAGVARDITQIRQDQERIRHLAEHDLLTDLPNRAMLADQMAAALAETIGEQAELALLFIDLDHFKDINDTLGHDVGDQLLVQVAQRLRANLDARDVVSRQGGDEFVILLRGYSNLTRIAAIAQRLIDAIVPPFLVAGHELTISASIGISAYPHDGADIGTLLKNADTAMYQAKATGGSAYQFFTAEMNERILERVAMEANLRRALSHREFVLHYQPQVDGESGRLIGVEALIRWHHPTQGEIPPVRFIPIAEESGLINGIGDWVLAEACRQARQWHDAGHTGLTMAVNLSAVQFRQRDLAEKVAGILAAAGLPPQALELEITESAFIRDTDRIVGVLTHIKELGIKLSVDDFGTGYSSLGYLKRLPFDKIKIDQSFIRDIPDDEDDIAITRAIIGIAGSLKKGLIAEGVETELQRAFLLDLGCREMQGYYFSRPVPAAAIEELLARSWQRIA